MTIFTLEEEIKRLTRIIDLLRITPSSIEEQIFLKYIELESLPKVKNHLQTEGIKTQRGTIYTASDISQIIKDSPDNVNTEIIDLAHKIFEKNWKAVDRAYN